MQSCTLTTCCGWLSILAPFVALAGVVESGFNLTRSTIDAGGAIHSTGGAFDLSGTVGQPDAGTLTGGAFELNGAFWIPLPPGDCEDDGDVDLIDYEQFRSCLTGPLGAGPSSACRCFDVDQSGAVDLCDVAVFQTTFSGR